MFDCLFVGGLGLRLYCSNIVVFCYSVIGLKVIFVIFIKDRFVVCLLFFYFLMCMEKSVWGECEVCEYSKEIDYVFFV